MDSFAGQMRAGRESARPRDSKLSSHTRVDLGVPGKLLAPLGTLIFNSLYRWPLVIVELDSPMSCCRQVKQGWTPLQSVDREASLRCRQ